MKTFSSLLPLVFVVTLFVSCTSRVLPTLPDGEQTVAGILKAAELSAVRRGSHIIEQEGVDVYYAESSLVHLREYQDKHVTLRGHFEYNTDPEDLPVFVVDSIVDVEETVKEHVLSRISVRFKAPVHWKLTEADGRYIFTTEGNEDPLLTVWQEPGDTLPEGGVPIVIDASRATRLVDELTNAQLIAVRHGDAILMLRFTPGKRITADRLYEDFVQLLKTVELLSTKEATQPVIGTGALSSPCGGTAGILCPSGYFCEIQDFTENIGRCRKI